MTTTNARLSAGWIVAIALMAYGAADVAQVPVADYAARAWELVPGAASGKLDQVVVVYQAKNQPVAQVNVMAGATSKALRTAGKWRAYEVDHLPPARAAALDAVVEKQGGVPCIALIRGGKIVKQAKLPASEDDLAALLKKNGGF